MTTFKEFRSVISLSIKDKSSSKRMREIERVLRETRALREPTPENATRAAELLGPTFVKIGQIASNRSDLLPREYCEAFANLRTNVPAMDFETVEQCITQSYGHPWQEVFAEIDATPLGSASIAQVHKARLLDGTTVAVKVRRPGVVETMKADIMLMRRIVATAEFLTPKTQVLHMAGSLIDELERTTLDELDFRVELSNLVRFRKDMDKQDGISSPLPYPLYSTKEILVMEFVDGYSICDKIAAATAQCDLSKAGEIVMESYVTQVIDNGFFHADPHPGNIQIRDGVPVWIDLGMVGTLDAGQRTAVSKIFLAIAGSNVYDLKEALLCVAVPSGEIDHGGLMQAIEVLLARYGNVSVDSMNVGQAFVDLTALLQNYNISLPASFTMLGRGFLTLEGVVSDIAPQVNLVKMLTEHVEGQMTSLGSTREKAKTLLVSSMASAEAAARLPKQASSTLDMLQKGQIGVSMNAGISNQLLGSVYTMVGRVSLALIAAALFIGSALMTTASSAGPELLNVPVLAYFGFLGSFVLSVYVIFTTIRTRHQIRNDLDIT